MQNCMVSQTNAAAAAVMGSQHSAHVGSRCAEDEGGVDSVTPFDGVEVAASPEVEVPLVAKEASFNIGFLAVAGSSPFEG